MSAALRALLAGAVPLFSLLLCLPGCVYDRTGRSGTSMMVRDVQSNRVAVEQVSSAVDVERSRIDEIDDRASAARRNIAESYATAESLVESVQALAGEFQQLRRQLEQSAAFDNDVDYRLAEMEFRLMAIEENLGIEPEVFEPEEPETPPEAPPGDDGLDAAAAAGEPGAAAARPEAGRPVIDLGALNGSNGSPADGGDGLELLALALQAFEDEQYTTAGKTLTDFLERHPDHERAGDARKLLGDALYAMGRYRQAISEYESFIQAFADHERVPEAMYRQGLCFIEMGTDSDLTSARVFLDDLIARFPDSPEAEKAKRKLTILE